MSYGPISSRCNLCSKSLKLNKLLKDLENTGRLIEGKWKDEGWGTTEVSGYEAYRESWESRMMTIPFEWDWRSFCLHCQFDIDYATVVLRAITNDLDEMFIYKRFTGNSGLFQMLQKYKWFLIDLTRFLDSIN